MPDKVQITIIGLGLIGASAGLALRRHQERVTVVGHDRNADRGAAARKLGAADRVEWNLPAAVEGADRILLAVPVDEMKDTLAALAGNLKPGCIILDTTEIKAPVLAWAHEFLPDDVHFVGGHPILVADISAAEQAAPDLFREHLFVLTPDARTSETAVQLAADLITALDARPFFMDAQEHDSLAAAMEQVPALMAAALLGVAARSQDWRDARRVAAGQFFSASLITPLTATAASEACLANRAAVLHWLDAMTAELTALRQQVAEGEAERLAGHFERALAARAEWLAAYSTNRWEEDGAIAEIPTSGSMLRSMLGLGGRRGRPADTSKR
jgi:prephenate dehydrogenase